MSAVTGAERLVFVDRLLARPWLRGAAKSFDKLACYALDVIDASWEVVKDPVIDVVENAAFSSLGQFTIGCLETGINVTANVLDVVLPVGDLTKPSKIPKEMDKGTQTSSKPDIVDQKKKIATRRRKPGNLQFIRTISASFVLSLRDLRDWVKLLKLEDDDICGHCTKRRKVIAPRRLGSRGIAYWIVGVATIPLQLVSSMQRSVLSSDITLSRNEYINKSPVRPMSATEKRKVMELDTTDEDDDERHTFHDDLGDYKSDEDVDYNPPERDDSTDSDEYAEGETESDVSLTEVTPTSSKIREARKGIKLHALNGDAKESEKKSDKGKKAAEADAKKPAADKSANTDKTDGKNAKKPETAKSGPSVDKQSGGMGIFSGQRSGGKDSVKSPPSGKDSVKSPPSGKDSVKSQSSGKDSLKSQSHGKDPGKGMGDKKAIPNQVPKSPLRVTLGL